jgi:hypothetical protein
MKLEQLIALKVGDKFKYKGQPAEVVNTVYVAEEIGRDEKTGVAYYNRYLNLYFSVNDQFVTLYSGYPDPKTLTLTEFE